MSRRPVILLLDDMLERIDRIVHDYIEVDRPLACEIVRVEVPELRAQLRALRDTAGGA